MHVKSLTLISHGLAMRILLPSLQHALEMKRQTIFLNFYINCAITKIQSYYKWLKSRKNLLVKVKKKYCGIKSV